MANQLTKKQKGFVKDYVKIGVGTLAVKNNYDVSDDNTAANIASENLSKPKIQKAIADRLPDDLLEERHLELLNKREIHRIGYGEDTEYELSDQPDTRAVSKALDMAYKLKGSYAPEKSVVNKRVLNIDITDEKLEQLVAEFDKRLQQELSGKHGEFDLV